MTISNLAKKEIFDNARKHIYDAFYVSNQKRFHENAHLLDPSMLNWLFMEDVRDKYIDLCAPLIVHLKTNKARRLYMVDFAEMIDDTCENWDEYKKYQLEIINDPNHYYSAQIEEANLQIKILEAKKEILRLLKKYMEQY
jgi:hypothetical protein